MEKLIFTIPLVESTQQQNGLLLKESIITIKTSV
jgi:hypothetical protein